MYVPEKQHYHISSNRIPNTGTDCGEIPKPISNCNSLQHLRIKSLKSLNGSIPTELGLLVNLQRLDLTNGVLTGPLPASFQNLTSLRMLYLGNNYITGSIPDYVFTNMMNLEILNLAFNRITGSVPRLSNLVFLRQVILHENSFININSDTFANSSSLELISLSSQGDLNLQEYAFRDTSQAIIELGGNILVNLPRGAFSGKRDTTLNLQNLFLKRLESKAFEKTSNMTLRLEGNMLESIATDTFDDATILGPSDCENFEGWQSLCDILASNEFCDSRTCSEQVTYTPYATSRLGVRARDACCDLGGGKYHLFHFLLKHFTFIREKVISCLHCTSCSNIINEQVIKVVPI